jgi:hypothetical protein
MKMRLDFKPGYESTIAYCLPFEFIVVGKDTNPKAVSNANLKSAAFTCVQNLTNPGLVTISLSKKHGYTVSPHNFKLN